MATVDTCPTCLQKIRKLNPHSMCTNKVQMLRILARQKGAWLYVEAGQRAFTESNEEIKVPYRASAHASVLVWFGLAEHSPDRRSALYRITKRGLRFLQGRTSIPKTIYCRDGVVVEETEDRVVLNDIKNVVFTKIDWDNYYLIQKPDGRNVIRKRKL